MNQVPVADRIEAQENFVLGYFILGSFRDNGQEHGNYCSGFRV